MEEGICVIVKANNDYYLEMLKQGNTWSIKGYESVVEALRSFEDAYNQAHDRGYSWSMSAVIHWMQFQPSIVKLGTDMDVVRKMLADPDKPSVTGLTSMAGKMNGLLLKKDAGEAAWNAGEHPRLIQP